MGQVALVPDLPSFQEAESCLLTLPQQAVKAKPNQSVAKANTLYGENKTLSELIRFLLPTLSLPLKQASKCSQFAFK